MKKAHPSRADFCFRLTPQFDQSDRTKKPALREGRIKRFNRFLILRSLHLAVPRQQAGCLSSYAVCRPSRREVDPGLIRAQMQGRPDGCLPARVVTQDQPQIIR